MPQPPVFEIDPPAFFADPYPTLARLRAEAPIAHVPQLGAVLISRHSDIYREEKRVETFSSDQPDGLMTKLMGRNMMRQDGTSHAAERKATFPAFSPRTVKDRWTAQFREAASKLLDTLAPQGHCDLVRDFALPLSGEALRIVTGLCNLSAAEIDAGSQAMIDGIANYSADPAIEANCRAATAKLNAAIDARAAALSGAPDLSLIGVQMAAGLSPEQTRANVKLAISGGQNETRDAIAGTAWALLTHPEQLELVRHGQVSWLKAFEEFARWISPIGMSPRRVARTDTIGGLDLEPESRAFFMFGSGNRDEAVFHRPDCFDVTRDTRKSLAFGAGPHFCAGAAASRAVVADVALPMLFERFPDMRLTGDITFEGWAFRGPRAVPVAWN